MPTIVTGESEGQSSALLTAWRKLPDAVPDGDSICRLIKAATDGPALERAHA
jgi:hypothetical protein